MRKTRLVILPTKCLHQMGFLLLFLSCPVIGDWGRIRPESENSHNAIQIEREGTCGLERDPPGGLLDFLNDTGSKQCRPSEDSDLKKPGNKLSIEEPTSVRRFDERRVHVRRINPREPERRNIERRDNRREFQRSVRSRSVESRRSTNTNDLRVRSLSLSRLESERTMRDRSVRRLSERSRRETERLHMTRQNERRVEEQRRLNRELPNVRRENEIRERNVAERREREIRRFTRSSERERSDIRRNNNRRSFQGFLRRVNDVRSENIRDRSERRLSLARKEVQDANKERNDIRRINLERRQPEMRKARSLEFIGREKLARTNRNLDNNRDAEDGRFVSLPVKMSERSVRERRVGLFNDKMGKPRRINIAAMRELNLENKASEDEKPFQWANFKNYESFKTGDWTTNCVIGAVVYYFTARQIKTV